MLPYGVLGMYGVYVAASTWLNKQSKTVKRLIIRFLLAPCLYDRADIELLII